MEKTASLCDTSLHITLLAISGILCLYLAELLSLAAFIVVTLTHVIIGTWFYSRNLLGKSQVLVIVITVFSLEVGRVFLQGRAGFVPALRDMIVLLALARLILPKSGREIYQLVGINFSQCILATIFTTSPLFLIGLVLQVFFIPVVLAHLDEHTFNDLSEVPRPDPVHWVLVCSSIIVISCILFFIIPRPSSAIIRGSITHKNRVGFSEELNLVRSSQLEEDARVVMRLVWNSGNTPDTVYLAGARLEELTAEGFVKHEEDLSDSAVPGTKKQRPTDHITIYPTGIDSRNVFYPYSLVSISPGTIVSQGSNTYWIRDIPPVYDLWITRTDSEPGTMFSSFPHELDDVAGLAKQIAGEGTAHERAMRVAEYVRKNNSYTLEGLDIPKGHSPISWFVFDGKKGTCEHFAAALATMLRACEIPSRVVTGFLVNEFNTSGNYFIIRARTAHAWVEFWDSQWHLLDATPLAFSGTVRRPSLIDSLRFTWIRWVIQYSVEDQISIAEYLVNSPWKVRERLDLAVYVSLAGMLLIFCVLFMLTMIRAKRYGPYRRVIRALEKNGVKIDVKEPHETHILEVVRQRPALEPFFSAYLKSYLSWRFGNKELDIVSVTDEFIEQMRKSPKT